MLPTEHVPPVSVRLGHTQVSGSFRPHLNEAVELGRVHHVRPFLLDGRQTVCLDFRSIEPAVRKQFPTSRQDKVDFFCFAFNDEECNSLHLGHFVPIEVLSKFKSLASMSQLELASHHIVGVVKLELKIVEHQLIRLKQQVLVDLIAMEIDGPAYFKFDLASVAQVLVNTDLLTVLEIFMLDLS